MSDNNRNVLIIIRWPGGGIRTFIRYVYKNIDKSKWNLTFLAPSSEGFDLIKEDLSDLDASYVGVDNIPTDGSSGAITFMRSIFTALQKNKYHLIHSHGFTAGLCTSALNYIFRVPHVMTPHDTFNDKQFLGVKGFLKKKTMLHLFKTLDKIHFISHDARENFMGVFPQLRHSGKCEVITSGIEVERFSQSEPRDLRGEIGAGDDVFLIGFLGRFMSLKGFRYLVDAIELLSKRSDLPKKPIVLTFGDGCFAAREWRDIKSRGLDDYFISMPFTDNVAGAIKGLDVVAMPSLSETCPLLPMETLVCGIPFIGTDCIGLREVIRDTPAYQIPKEDAGALTDVLLAEMTFSRKCEFMDFSEKAARRYDVRQASNKMFDLYMDTAC